MASRGQLSTIKRAPRRPANPRAVTSSILTGRNAAARAPVQTRTTQAAANAPQVIRSASGRTTTVGPGTGRMLVRPAPQRAADPTRAGITRRSQQARQGVVNKARDEATYKGAIQQARTRDAIARGYSPAQVRGGAAYNPFTGTQAQTWQAPTYDAARMGDTPVWNAPTYDAAEMGDTPTWDAPTYEAARMGDTPVWEVPTTEAALAEEQARYDAQNYRAARARLGNESLVEGRLSNLLMNESPYMMAARQRALEQANARGLLNSSMAINAAHRAAIEASLPIAQQDAQTMAQRAFANQQAINQQRGQYAQLQTDVLNRQAALGQQVELANQGALNETSARNQALQAQALAQQAGFQQQAGLANQAAQNEALARNQAVTAQALTQQAGFEQQAGLANQAARNEALARNQAVSAQALTQQAGFEQQAGLANQAAQNEALARNQATTAAALTRQNELDLNAQLANQAAANTARQFGAANTQQANLANQAAANTARQFGAQLATQTDLANAEAANRAALQYQADVAAQARQAAGGAASVRSSAIGAGATTGAARIRAGAQTETARIQAQSAMDRQQAAQGWQTQERVGTQQFTTGERLGREQFAGEQGAAERDFQRQSQELGFAHADEMARLGLELDLERLQMVQQNNQTNQFNNFAANALSNYNLQVSDIMTNPDVNMGTSAAILEMARQSLNSTLQLGADIFSAPMDFGHLGGRQRPDTWLSYSPEVNPPPPAEAA